MKNEKVEKKGTDWLIILFTAVAKFFIYLHVYVKNFKNPKIHIFGFFMSIVAFIYLPKPHIAGCTNTEWFLLLIPTVFVCSGVVSGWILVKTKGRTEAKQTLQSENPQSDYADAEPNKRKNRDFEQNCTIEEGIEDIIPLENGGFRRIYKVRRG